MISVCQRHNNYIMSRLLADSGAFLFPCTIEYSLICAAILFIMWKNIAEEHEHYEVHNRRRKISRNLAAAPITGSVLSKKNEKKNLQMISAESHLVTGVRI